MNDFNNKPDTWGLAGLWCYPQSSASITYANSMRLRLPLAALACTEVYEPMTGGDIMELNSLLTSGD